MSLAINPDPIVVEMEQRLAGLEPELMEIYDESADHAGHAGAQSGGGHYQLLIASKRFENESAVARHRLIYAALGDMMRKQIHALAITALTPQELRDVFPA